MQVRGFPTHLDPCYLAMEVETEPHVAGQEIPFEVRFIDEDGHVITHVGLVLQLGIPGDVMMQRTFIPMPIPWDDKCEFTGPGVFRFDLVAWPGSERETVLGGETLVVQA